MTRRTPNAYRIVSRKFVDIKDKIIAHLQKNHVINIFVDFAEKNQLRVPFTNTNPFYKPLPQSIISLHHQTGAPIVPVICHPDRENIGQSIIEFLDPTPLAELSKKLKNASEEEFHGQMSYKLNQQLSRFLLQYPHIWEELIALGKWRKSLVWKFDKTITRNEFLIKMEENILYLLKKSYVPNYSSLEFQNTINKIFIDAKSQLKQLNLFVLPNNFRINYFSTNYKTELYHIFQVLIQLFRRIGENEVAYIFEKSIPLVLYH
jgi:hypothetical protein